MALEIERKFLVADPSCVDGRDGEQLRQGYLCDTDRGVVRVRTAGDHGYLTVKSRAEGNVRQEYEYEVPLSEAVAMLALCADPPVEKIRYRIEHAGLVWEVDVFSGANAGLVTAECELGRADQAVAIPAWVGAEVSDDRRYGNSQLARRPYTTW